MSSKPLPTDDGQGGEQSRLDRIRADTDWTALAKLGGAAVLGLAVNTVAVSAFVGGGIPGIADGVAYLAPTTVLAVVLFHRYDPVGMAYLSPALMFLTMLGANTASLIIRTARMGFGMFGQSLLSFVLLAFVALMFLPGPFLGAWAARRWWV